MSDVTKADPNPGPSGWQRTSLWCVGCGVLGLALGLMLGQGLIPLPDFTADPPTHFPPARRVPLPPPLEEEVPSPAAVPPAIELDAVEPRIPGIITSREDLGQLQPLPTDPGPQATGFARPGLPS